MAEYEGHDIPGRRLTLQQLARSELVTVVSRGAMVLVAGILIWGFNRLDSSITKLSDTIVNIMVEQATQKHRLDALERATADRMRP